MYNSYFCKFGATLNGTVTVCNVRCSPQALFNGRAAQQFCRATQLRFQAYQVSYFQIQFHVLHYFEVGD